MRNCESLLKKHDPKIIDNNTQGLSRSRVRELMIEQAPENADIDRPKPAIVRKVVPFTCTTKFKSRKKKVIEPKPSKKYKPYTRTKTPNRIKGCAKSTERRHLPLGEFTCKIVRKSRVVKKFISEMMIAQKTLILLSERSLVIDCEIRDNKVFITNELASMPDHLLITRIE